MTEKDKIKLKMMEISFEQINNSRNDLIKQLSEQEQLNEKLIEKLKIHGVHQLDEYVTLKKIVDDVRDHFDDHVILNKKYYIVRILELPYND